MLSSKKQPTTLVRNYEVFENEEEANKALQDYVPDTPEEKKLVRKLDMTLMPMLWIMYIFNYVDRTNIVSLPIVQL
jgi:hypothetical protein